MAKGRNTSKKQQRTETIQESFEYLFRWCVSLLVTVYAMLILGVLPFYFEEGFTHIGTDKSTFFRGCTVFFAKIMIPALIIWLLSVGVVVLYKKRAGEKIKFRINLSLADGFAIAYGVSVFLSYLCTDYQKTALWGIDGWYMGLLPHLTLVSIYFLVSRLVVFPQYVLYLCIPVSTVTFVLGYLNRFDIWPLSMENSGLPLYISTIGNINWFCGYIISVVFVGIGLLWLDEGGKKWRTVLLSVYTCMGFAMLVTQGSDSGLFALAVVMVVMFVLSAKSAGKMKQFWLIVGLLAVACLITFIFRRIFPGRMNYTSGMIDLLTQSKLSILMLGVALVGWWYAGRNSSTKVWPVLAKVVCGTVAVAVVGLVVLIAVNTTHPGSLGPLSEKSVFTFNDKWGSNRGATWRYGLACFAEQDGIHKLTGVGSDCMAEYLYKGSSEALREDVKSTFVNKRLTNAHNEMLTLLVNEGLLGMITYGGLLGTLLWKLLKAYNKNRHAAVCGLCLLGYIANNVWSFQQSLSVSTIFVIIGLGTFFLRSEGRTN